MRNVAKLSLATAMLILSIAGCKRETITEQASKTKSENVVTTVSPGSQGSGVNAKDGNSILSWRASQQEIDAAVNAWLASVASQRSGSQSKGFCNTHVSDFNMVIGYNGTCQSAIWDIDYLIISYDAIYDGLPILAPASETFTPLAPNPSFTYTLTNSAMEQVDPSCNAYLYGGYCDFLRKYYYHLTNVPTLGDPWPQYNGSYSLVLDHNTPGNPNCPTTLTASGLLIGKYTPQEYASMPAAVYPIVTNISGSYVLYIYGHCQLLCPGPRFGDCPVSGTFILTNTTTNQVQTFSYPFPAGTPVSLTSGVYTYSSVLNYNIGGVPVTSQTLTGGFTVP